MEHRIVVTFDVEAETRIAAWFEVHRMLASLNLPIAVSRMCVRAEDPTDLGTQVSKAVRRRLLDPRPV